ncbi:MAG: lipoprotein [Nitrospinaceae bacterium]|nr:MAG: lipoprotein [Nitrospinaceae bacterium]
MKGDIRKYSGGMFEFLLIALFSLIFTSSAAAASAKSIDLDVNEALANFNRQVNGSKEFLKKAKGVLVFPSVIKAGFGIGGEYGEGALRINGKTREYYNTVAGSFGFQIGVQAKTIILAFMEKSALAKFRNSDGWKVGVDGSVALITLGMGDSLDTINAKDPIVAFVFGQKGLMYNLTLEGSKITKLNKS